MECHYTITRKIGGLLLVVDVEKKNWSGMVIKLIAIEFVHSKYNYSRHNGFTP